MILNNIFLYKYKKNETLHNIKYMNSKKKDSGIESMHLKIKLKIPYAKRISLYCSAIYLIVLTE